MGGGGGGERGWWDLGGKQKMAFKEGGGLAKNKKGKGLGAVGKIL